jgi:hypothetical protein
VILILKEEEEKKKKKKNDRNASTKRKPPGEEPAGPGSYRLGLPRPRLARFSSFPSELLLFLLSIQTTSTTQQQEQSNHHHHDGCFQPKRLSVVSLFLFFRLYLKIPGNQLPKKRGKFSPTEKASQKAMDGQASGAGSAGNSSDFVCVFVFVSPLCSEFSLQPLLCRTIMHYAREDRADRTGGSFSS